MVNRLVGPTAQKHRQPHLPALELSLMQQPRARQREQRHCRGASLSIRKCGGSPRLVMVLDEPDHFLLIGGIREQVLAHALGTFMIHPVVEFLVVAEIKTFLLQFPLEVPVGLGDEPELADALLSRRR